MPGDADDICQSAFLRVFRRADTLDADHMAAMAVVAAWNLALNLLRDRARQAVPIDELPQVAALHDVQQTADWRIELERTLDVVATLSKAEQEAVVRHLTGVRGQDKREQDRQALRLFRARARLREKVGPLFAGLPVWRWRLTVPEVMHAASAMAVSVVVAAGALSIGSSAPQAGAIGDVPATSPSLALSVDAVGQPASMTPIVQRATMPSEPHEAVEPAMEATPPTPRAPVMRLAAPAETEAGGELDATPRQPNEGLACVSAPHVQTVCVPHPLRP